MSYLGLCIYNYSRHCNQRRLRSGSCFRPKKKVFVSCYPTDHVILHTIQLMKELDFDFSSFYYVTCCKQRWHLGITSPSSVCLSVCPVSCFSRHTSLFCNNSSSTYTIEKKLHNMNRPWWEKLSCIRSSTLTSMF